MHNDGKDASARGGKALLQNSSRSTSIQAIRKVNGAEEIKQAFYHRLKTFQLCVKLFKVLCTQGQVCLDGPLGGEVNTDSLYSRLLITAALCAINYLLH